MSRVDVTDMFCKNIQLQHTVIVEAAVFKTEAKVTTEKPRRIVGVGLPVVATASECVLKNMSAFP